MIPKSKIIPEEELRRLYWDKEMSIPEIGEAFGVSNGTIYNWMKLYDMPRRTISESRLICDVDVLTKKDLHRMYYDEEKSMSEIAAFVGVCRWTIRSWMGKYGIPIRTQSEAHLLVDNRGPNHHFWKGGPKTYCYKFNNRLREAVRERDDYICQNCGKYQEENIGRLCVHHIHYDAENCYPDLISLCTRCHMSSNSNRDWWETHYMCILAERGLLEWKPAWVE